MNAYDFDDTIYAGESIYDFFFFCLKKDWWLILYMPVVILRLVQYKLNLLNIEKIRKTVQGIINHFFKYKNIEPEILIKQFWVKNRKKIKPEFLLMLKEDDLIITGCPNFLIDEIKDILKVKNIICSEFNFKTKKLEFICFGENKVKAFEKRFPNTKINKFYTDSLADVPFMQYAQETYFVKGKKINKISKEEISKK